MNLLLLVRNMHRKFGIETDDIVKPLSAEEKEFRRKCMQEELNEWCDATDREEEFDALIDLIVFALGTIDRQGMSNIFDEGAARVMLANTMKELTGSGNEKRGNFAIDLVKPEGWKAPDHSDLVLHSGKPTGLIVLEGVDASGKSTLARHFQSEYDAEVIHCTWSPELENHMDSYIIGTIVRAIELSKTKLVIIDRSWLSELIYSHVFRDGTQYPGLADTCMELLEHAVAIVCMPEYEKWVPLFHKMSNERDEMYAGKLDKMTKVAEYYVSAYTGLMANGDELESALVSFDGLFNNFSYMPYDLFNDDISHTAALALKRLYTLKNL